MGVIMLTKQKDTFAEFRKLYHITILKQHRQGAKNLIIMVRRNLGTKSGIKQSTMLTQAQKGGNLRRK